MSMRSLAYPYPCRSWRDAARWIITLGLVLAGSATAGAELGTSSRFSVHGHLTQALADAGDFAILGIPTDGTTDYRTAAIQFRYQMGEGDYFVVQLSHEAAGDSVILGLKDEIELDWAFYQHRFADDTTVRVGRVAIPFGIFNEIRDVGTLLPFYLPPQTLYSEGIFANETLDGIVVSHPFDLGSGAWSLEASAFFGGWDFVQSASLSEATVERSWGTQLWLHSPVPGLRFGTSYRRSRVEGLDGVPLGLDRDIEDIQLSIDADLDRFTARAEILSTEFETGIDALSYYVQLGVALTDRLRVTAQVETTDLELVVEPFGTVDVDYNDEVAVAVGYQVGDAAVLRLEHHWNEGFVIDEQPPDYLVRFATGRPFETEYSILSLSVSF